MTTTTTTAAATGSSSGAAATAKSCLRFVSEKHLQLFVSCALLSRIASCCCRSRCCRWRCVWRFFVVFALCCCCCCCFFAPLLLLLPSSPSLQCLLVFQCLCFCCARPTTLTLRIINKKKFSCKRKKKHKQTRKNNK